MNNQYAKLKKILYIQNFSNRKNGIILNKKLLALQNFFNLAYWLLIWEENF